MLSCRALASEPAAVKSPMSTSRRRPESASWVLSVNPTSSKEIAGSPEGEEFWEQKRGFHDTPTIMGVFCECVDQTHSRPSGM